jgi:hypothetical protein
MLVLLHSKIGGLLREVKPLAKVRAFYLADHDIKVTFLVFCQFRMCALLGEKSVQGAVLLYPRLFGLRRCGLGSGPIDDLLSA